MTNCCRCFFRSRQLPACDYQPGRVARHEFGRKAPTDIAITADDKNLFNGYGGFPDARRVTKMPTIFVLVAEKRSRKRSIELTSTIQAREMCTQLEAGKCHGATTSCKLSAPRLGSGGGRARAVGPRDSRDGRLT